MAKKSNKRSHVAAAKAGASATPFSDALKVNPGFSLARQNAHAKPAFRGNKAAGAKALSAITDEVSGLQERLFAESKVDGKRSLLLVVQGMDTAGKGGIMRHVVG